jgi:hypothetical protein
VKQLDRDEGDEDRPHRGEARLGPAARKQAIDEAEPGEVAQRLDERRRGAVRAGRRRDQAP